MDVGTRINALERMRFHEQGWSSIMQPLYQDEYGILRLISRQPLDDSVESLYSPQKRIVSKPRSSFMLLKRWCLANLNILQLYVFFPKKIIGSHPGECMKKFYLKATASILEAFCQLLAYDHASSSVKKPCGRYCNCRLGMIDMVSLRLRLIRYIERYCLFGFHYPGGKRNVKIRA